MCGEMVTRSGGCEERWLLEVVDVWRDGNYRWWMCGEMVTRGGGCEERW